jgi:NADH-quinone oxidoreductase subunit L
MLGEIEKVPFSFVPLLISLLVALGGLLLGWLVYRNYKAGQVDPLQKGLGPIYRVLKNKYYFDEMYQTVFINPVIWLSDTFSNWMDLKVIDGILHAIAHVVGVVGSFLRNAIDKPIINGFGDIFSEFVKRMGFELRPIQTGKIQQYMIMALVTVTTFAILYFYLLAR